MSDEELLSELAALIDAPLTAEEARESGAADSSAAHIKARRVLAALGEVREVFEVRTSGVRYPCGTEAAAWRQFADLKATRWANEVEIGRYYVITSPWREVSP